MFHFELTEDGSPTLRLAISSSIAIGESGDPSTRGEAMHSLKGAFSETLYIYGSAIETALSSGFRPRVLSLGLGLGYVEILSVAQFLMAARIHPKPAEFLSTCGGESFELVPELRDYFVSWATRSGVIPGEFAKVYDEILSRTSSHVGVSTGEIRENLSNWLKNGQWKIRPAMTAETRFDQPFGCICFDAFSSKTSPELWSEEFLGRFLEDAAAPTCVLSTYACTGALKRSLKNAGFNLTIREGFASKRDSTFAVRSPR